MPKLNTFVRTPKNRHLWWRPDETIRVKPASQFTSNSPYGDINTLKLPWTKQGRENYDRIFSKKKA